MVLQSPNFNGQQVRTGYLNLHPAVLGQKAFSGKRDGDLKTLMVKIPTTLSLLNSISMGLLMARKLTDHFV